MTLRILSMFDMTGEMVRPWAEAGHECLIVDTQNEHARRDNGVFAANLDLRDPGVLARLIAWRPDIVFGFPPCTDLAVSGAKHFASKRARNPRFQDEAVALARTVEAVGEGAGVPWFVENPVSVLASLWRPSDASFHPYEFGAYLSEDEAEHPTWPEIIRPFDAYPKKTCLWTGGGFELPAKRPVPVDPGYSDQFKKLGGKSLKTKNIRSATPRGFARAVFEHWEPILMANRTWPEVIAA